MANEAALKELSELAAARATVAILYKNGRFEIEPTEENRKWALLGSGVLIAANRVLTTGHVIGQSRLKRRKKRRATVGVFVPGRGIFKVVRVNNEPNRPDKYDFMNLLGLERKIAGAPTIPPGRFAQDEIQENQTRISGFGVWEDQKHIPSGLLRMEPIPMGSTSRLHNLDLQWSHEQHGPIPIHENSGGPVVYPSEPAAAGRVVGVIREVTKTDVVASRIAKDRWKWLGNFGIPEPLDGNGEQRRFIVTVQPRGVLGARTVSLDAPTRALTVTLNATRKCWLSVVPGANREDEASAKLKANPPGRFLVRKLENDMPFDAITVAVAGFDDYWDLRAQLRWSVPNAEAG